VSEWLTPGDSGFTVIGKTWRSETCCAKLFYNATNRVTTLLSCSSVIWRRITSLQRIQAVSLLDAGGCSLSVTWPHAARDHSLHDMPGQCITSLPSRVPYCIIHKRIRMTFRAAVASLNYTSSLDSACARRRPTSGTADERTTVLLPQAAVTIIYCSFGFRV